MSKANCIKNYREGGKLARWLKKHNKVIVFQKLDENEYYLELKYENIEYKAFAENLMMV